MDRVSKVFISSSSDDPLEFVMSDETVDRMGDIIEAKGWDLSNFKNNPVALFGHDSRFVIGKWAEVKVRGKQLIGRLELLPAGISERLDEILAAIQAGILRAVSVGFRALEYKEIEGTNGLRFTKSELLECSVVSVPANPNALQLAKSLNLSPETQSMIFGKSADEILALRGAGVNAVTRTLPPAGPSTAVSATPKNGNTKMTLAERIQKAQEDLVRFKDQLTEHTAGDDVDPLVVDELSNQIEAKEAELASFRRAEAALAGSTGDGPAVERNQLTVPANRLTVPAAPKLKLAPGDHVLRSMVVGLISHVTKQSPQDILLKAYGEDDVTKMVMEGTFTKAATAPATTTTSGWASQLVETVVADFMESLLPSSVYPGLSSRGLRLTFGRNGAISIPTRSATPTIAGSFVAEGAPIPVRQGAFSSASLTPKKMAVISTFTREIATHSIPAIEGLIRDAIREDTAVAIDTVLLDATAASSVRPAGIRNGVTVTTATSGGGIDALRGDVLGLVGALITATNGNVRAPVWIMNPLQALAIGLTADAMGATPFAAEMAQGRFSGFPVIQSATVTSGMLILVDAADFVSVTGDEPNFDVSDQATLHMEDTTPTAIGTAGTPNAVAAPVRSLWQTDTLALRMILPMNWILRRSGVVAWTENVTW